MFSSTARCPAGSIVRAQRHLHSGKVATVPNRPSTTDALSNPLFSTSAYSSNRKLALILKMVAITAPPLIALFILSLIMGIQFASQIGGATTAQSYLKSTAPLNAFITIIQRELDATCAYTDGTNKKVLLNSLKVARNETDNSLRSLKSWPTDEDFTDVFLNPLAFLDFLSANRPTFDDPAASCFDVTQFYTSQIHYIVRKTKDMMFESEEGLYWRLVDALQSVSTAADLANLKRTIGRKFFQKGFMDISTFKYFSDAAGCMDRFLDQAITSASYNSTPDNERIQSTIDSLRDMESDLYANRTHNTIGDDLAEFWYDNMTVFINNNIKNLQVFINNQIAVSSKERQVAKDWQFGSAMFAAVIAVLLCAPIACWVGFDNYDMSVKIDKKMFELNTERLKTDLLLHEMLPHTIIVDLKAGRRVEPVLFSSATVYFSDILGFTALSAKSKPTEVVTLLNALYSTMDTVLDRYSCYKVETIGDAYMVVSGVPKENGNEHSGEICTMALDLLREVSEIKIPHIPQEHLLLRIGIHTGPVAAGIVGLKMPRYCLFGDTVNTASRMESSGEPMCIHLSQTTAEHLQVHHFHKQFVCQQLEDLLDIKGKGMMKTFWLLRKHGFPYEIDLDKSRSLVEQGQYWRFD
uniref:Guanylate cyclase domain-containing protein n=1 Tax=Plectus sambesii TaxID=2011161 RepID=A0A914XAT5_9BILA